LRLSSVSKPHLTQTKRGDKSSEEWPKTQDEAVDQIRHVLERFDNRFTLNDPRLAERYIEAEIHLLVHFTVRPVDEEFVAYFERAEFVGGVQVNRREQLKCLGQRAGECVLHHLGQVDAMKCRTHGNQKTMLIDTIKLVETPERVVPSTVWFGSVDSIYCVLPYSLYYSIAKGWVTRGVPGNGVTDTSRIGWGTTDSENDELVSQVVQGTPEILEGIARDCGDDDRNRLEIGDVINQLSRLRIALGGDLIWPGIMEDSDCRLNITDVLLGPFDFRPNQRKTFIGDHRMVDSAYGKQATDAEGTGRGGITLLSLCHFAATLPGFGSVPGCARGCLVMSNPA